MASLSLCMIVKNEEDVLGRCLSSMGGVADEIIIADTGSSDSTKQIAYDFNAKVFDFEWIDDFAAARNFAFSKAKMDYIIWLDADDVIKSEDLEKLKKIKTELNGAVSQVAALYNVGFDENGFVTMAYYRERILKNNKLFFWEGLVHECIPFASDVIYADFAVTHFKTKPAESGRNLKIYEKLKLKRALIPREQYYYARELFYNGHIDKAEETFLSFLESDGWGVNKIDACMMLSKCRLKQNDSRGAILAIFNSFLYGEPTAEACCEIGRLFMEESNYKQAVYWYGAAMSRVPDMRNGGFINTDAHTFLPCIQLCVCYDRLGNREMSRKYNEFAASFKPKNKALEYNRKYFNSLLGENTSNE